MRKVSESFPVLISGAGGSGKTLAMLKKLQSVVASHDHSQLKILCITGSGNLAYELSNKWQGCHQQTEHSIQFITYNQWVEQYTSGRVIVNDSHLEDWYNKYIDQQNRLLQTKSTSPSGRKSKTPICFPLTKDEIDREAVKQTFKMLAGREKSDVSARNLLFPIELKDILLDAYDQYLAYLGDTHVHPEFFQIPVGADESALFDIMFIDEAQNFTFLQIQNLYYKAKLISNHDKLARAICINYDSHQILNSHISDRELILQFIEHELKQKPAHIILQGNYRSHEDIIKWTDHCVGLKYLITCGLGDNNEDARLTPGEKAENSEPSPIKEMINTPPFMLPDEEAEQIKASSPTHNHVFWPEKLDSAQFNFHSGRWIIITHDEFLEEAISLYGNAFTFKEAIGLESDFVCLHRPFDHKAFVHINTILSHVESTDARPEHEAKKQMGSKKYTAYLNAIISGALRGKLFLVINQNKKSTHLRHLMKRINAKNSNTQPVVIEDTSLSPEALRTKLTSLILNNNKRQAALQYDNSNGCELFKLSYPAFEARVLHTSDVNSIKPKIAKPSKLTITTAPASVMAKLSPALTPKPPTPSPSKSLKKPEDLKAYLKNLLTKLNEPNLESFFKLKNAISYLSHKIEDEFNSSVTMLFLILDHDDHCAVFCKYLMTYDKNKIAKDLIQCLYNDYKDEDGNHIEHTAAKANCYYLLSILIDRGLDLGRYNDSNENACYLAIANGCTETINELMRVYRNPFLYLNRISATSDVSDYPLSYIQVINYGSIETRRSFYAHNAQHTGLKYWNPIAHMKNVKPLHFAVQCNSIETVEQLIHEKYDVNETFGENQVCALHIAAQHGYSEIFHLLLQNNANINQATTDGITALHLLAQTNHIQMIEIAVMYNANFDLPMKNGVVPIMIAICRDKMPMLGALLFSGCDIPNEVCIDDTRVALISISKKSEVTRHLIINKLIRNELMNLFSSFKIFSLDKLCCEHPSLVFCNQHLKFANQAPMTFIEIVLSHPVFPSILVSFLKRNRSVLIKMEEVISDFHGCTLFSLSARYGVTKIMQLLIESGISLEKLDFSNNTALLYALKYGQNDAAKFLIDSGANVNVINSRGSNALHFAVEHCSVEITRQILKKVTPETLNAYQTTGHNALTLAAFRGKFEMVSALLEHRLHLSGVSLQAAVYFAASSGGVEVLDLLLAESAIDVNTRANDGLSPLIIAIVKGHTNVVQRLLRDPRTLIEYPSFLNITPLAHACMVNNKPCIKLLLKAGADIRNLSPEVAVKIKDIIEAQQTAVSSNSMSFYATASIDEEPKDTRQIGLGLENK